MKFGHETNKRPPTVDLFARGARLLVRSFSVEAVEERIAKQADEQLKLEIEAKRNEHIKNPDYKTLLENKRFQLWKKTNGLNDASSTNPVQLSAVYQRIDNGEIGSTYQNNPYKYIEEYVDPNFSESRLESLAIAYCRRSANSFEKRAYYWADKLGRYTDGSIPISEEKEALASLIGTTAEDEVDTIFKDQSWHIASYVPDFIQLRVSLDDSGIERDKIMAGVGLCVGLWVRLADAGAKRPVSGGSFGPPFEHCSFVSLISDTGWAEYNDLETISKKAQFDSESSESIMKPFRSQDFSANAKLALDH